MNGRQGVKKSTKKGEASEGVHQLTDIDVVEVSIVDRAANLRTFVTRKSQGAETPAETAKRIQDKIALRGDANPGAEADAAAATGATATTKADATDSDVADGVPAVSAHAAAATAHAAAAEAANDDTKKKPAKKGDVAPLPAPGTAAAPAVVPTSAAVVENPEAELLALAKAATAAPVSTTKATEIAVQTNEDGSVTISVDDQPTIISNPSLPSTVQDKIKTSVVAGIDAIMLRMATLRQSVVASTSSYSASGTPSELYDLGYITSMIYSLYDIGGPTWEIEQAADAALDAAAGVDKSAGAVEKRESIKVQKNKVINMARTLKLRAAHVAMEYAHKDMGKVLKELDSEGGDATGEMASSTSATDGTPTDFAKAAATQVVKDIKEDPEYKALAASLVDAQAALTKSNEANLAMQKVVQDQGNLIAKARGNVDNSNAPAENISKAADNDVEWDLDLAPPRDQGRGSVSKNFGRGNDLPLRRR